MSYVYADSSIFTPYAKYYRLNYEDMENGSVKVQGVLFFESIFNKLGDHWVTKRDLSGLNNYFNYKPSSLSKNHNKWEDGYGQTFLFNIAVRPADWFFAELGFEMIGDYADRYWIPVNEEHRLSYNEERAPLLDWSNARIGIITDYFSLVYHRNYKHDGWEREGDMFSMFVKHDAPDNYLRYSGHHTSDFWQFKTKGVFGDLDIIGGEEAMQDYKRGIYVKYKNIFGSNINFFYSDHVIPFGSYDERMRNLQINTDFNFWNESNVQIGALFRPFRVGESYYLAEEVGFPNGYGGSKYDIYSDETVYSDAFGGSIKFKFPKKILALDMVTLGYEYRGLVAGNRQRIDVSFEKKTSNTTNAFLSYYYQKPLLNAMPLVYSGANEYNWPPVLSSPRGPESPFWVWWRNPISGFDNRETSAFSFIFTYDPTPSTWFYNYDPNLPLEYNLNPEEDAPFSFAIKADASQYFGQLDRQSFWEYDGSTVWEDAYSNGTRAPDRYIGSLYFLSQFIKGKTKILYDFEVGEDLATLSYPYPDSDGAVAREPFTTPMIGYFKTSLKVKHEPYIFKVGYLKNTWGPEDWHRNFGSSYDEVYLAHISRDIGDLFNVGMEYVGARKNNSKILHDPRFAEQDTRNETGSFDELRVYLRIMFDVVVRFGTDTDLPFVVEHDKIAPELALKTRPDTIYSDKGENAVLEPWVSDPSGTDKWKIYIKNQEGQIVKTYEGEKEPPEELEWYAKDNNEQIVPNGPYYATLEAYDNYGNYGITEPSLITVMTEPKIKEA
ncbi:MAG: hypothetical protein LBQ47_01445, partial [Endomicrobium sp.]|nr:hypothetical protein [Endomicrobium sp.]